MRSPPGSDRAGALATAAGVYVEHDTPRFANRAGLLGTRSGTA